MSESQRPIPYYTKPRVVFCRLTRKWVVGETGNAHRCGSSAYPSDLAFADRGRAFEHANEIGRARLRLALEVRDRCGAWAHFDDD